MGSGSPSRFSKVILFDLRSCRFNKKYTTLKFFDGDLQERFACWSYLKELFDHEAKTITKLSKLTSSYVSPSNLERQKVASALNVFSDQTASALQNSEAKKDTWEMTAMFILKVVKLWKVLNCKNMNERARLKDDYRVAIDSNEENKGVGVLKEWADCAKSMTSAKGHVRKHCLTTDTGMLCITPVVLF
ncbi:developmentally-regulated GTP-binding protein 2 [Plakobranchus ocellatus]|uniref:Developmentally-regulated GTP-binding protein 2 n=1 Tax=Plakobranchus ocellatus TaxID=259542 RepID=A0AAV3Y2J2_9GAST|nr:developmentally-regulated GTP-binding protein 2 [Plakobranchus ocellatus]